MVMVMVSCTQDRMIVMNRIDHDGISREDVF